MSLSYILNFLGLVARAASHNYDADWARYAGQQYVRKLTDEDGRHFVRNTRICLLFFYSKHCSFCEAMKPEIAATAAELARRGSPIKVACVEGKTYKSVARAFHVNEVPTLNLYRNGKFVVEYIWTRKASAITEFVIANS